MWLQQSRSLHDRATIHAQQTLRDRLSFLEESLLILRSKGSSNRRSRGQGLTASSHGSCLDVTISNDEGTISCHGTSVRW